MKISLTEIWNFIEMIAHEEKGWCYSLIAGKVVINDLTQSDLETLKNDLEYDTELLPTLFTFREILWQPDVFTERNQSLTPLKILKAYCEEVIESMNSTDRSASTVYTNLLAGIVSQTDEALERLEKKSTGQSVNSILGDFRTEVFPIIKFFVYHPQNRVDYYRDAVNRLNFAVKIMLTEYQGKYTELSDPYWEISYEKSIKQSKKQSD